MYCLVFGATLVVAAILGFIENSSFATGDNVSRDQLLGLFDVNGWHSVVHLVSGAIGLALAGSRSGARIYAFGFGGVYVLVTILGLAAGDNSTLFNVIAINTADNFLHLSIAAVGILAGALSPAETRPPAAPDLTA